MDLKANYQVQVHVLSADRFNNPAGSFDSPPVYSLDDASLGSVVAAADGLSAIITPSGKLGSSIVKVIAQVGGLGLQDSLPINFIAGDAVKVILSAGAPSLGS